MNCVVYNDIHYFPKFRNVTKDITTFIFQAYFLCLQARKFFHRCKLSKQVSLAVFEYQKDFFVRWGARHLKWFMILNYQNKFIVAFDSSDHNRNSDFLLSRFWLRGPFYSQGWVKSPIEFRVDWGGPIWTKIILSRPLNPILCLLYSQDLLTSIGENQNGQYQLVRF